MLGTELLSQENTLGSSEPEDHGQEERAASAKRCLSIGVSEHATPQLWQTPTQVHLHIYTKKDNSQSDQSWLASLKLSGYSSTVPFIDAKLKLSLNKGK